MRFTAAALVLLPAVVAQTNSPPTETGEFQVTRVFSNNADYSSYYIQQGYKPAVVSYLIGLETNTVVESAFDEYYKLSFEYNYALTGPLATETSRDPVQALQFLEAQVTAVTDTNARAVISSVFNEQIAIQTAAAAPTDLAVSAGIAGIVAAAAGLAIGL